MLVILVQLQPLCRRMERLQEAVQPKEGRTSRMGSFSGMAATVKLRQLQADKQQAEAEAQLLRENVACFGPRLHCNSLSAEAFSTHAFIKA